MAVRIHMDTHHSKSSHYENRLYSQYVKELPALEIHKNYNKHVNKYINYSQ